MAIAVTAFTALILGFCAGLWGCKIKSRWCPRCGGMTYPPSDIAQVA